MSTAFLWEEPRRLDVGRVAVETFAVIRRQWRILVPLTVVIVTGTSLADTVVRAQIAAASVEATITHAVALWRASGLSLATTVFATFGSIAQIGVALLDLDSETPRLRAVLNTALSKLAPALGASILIWLGVVLGSLLVVLGVMLAVAWCVGLPAIVAETSNIPRALARSRALTRGNRWRIFLLMAAAGLAFLVMVAPEIGIAAMTHTSGGAANQVAIALLNTLASLVMSVGSAVLYVQLRDLKGGGGERLAQAFA